MRKIKYITIHCTAGFTLIPAIENFWYNSLKWKSPGYHIIVYEDGTLWYLGKDKKYHTDSSKLDISQTTNGVAGFNSNAVHISYVGGISKTNKNLAVDSRTEAQKKSIISAITLVQNIISKNGQDTSEVKIQGHRDFSPDKNGNGVIDSWERIKECPSFDAIPEYKYLIPKSSDKPKYYYTLSNLNLREGGGTNFKTIGSPIPKGDSVVILELGQEWSKVKVTKDGRIGYVSTKYLR